MQRTVVGRMESTGKSQEGHKGWDPKHGMWDRKDTEITKDGECGGSVGHKDRDTKDGT